MHSLKGALAGLTLSLILLASESVAHPTQGYEDSYGKAGFLGLCGANDDSKNKWVSPNTPSPPTRRLLGDPVSQRLPFKDVHSHVPIPDN